MGIEIELLGMIIELIISWVSTKLSLLVYQSMRIVMPFFITSRKNIFFLFFCLVIRYCQYLLVHYPQRINFHIYVVFLWLSRITHCLLAANGNNREEG